MLGEELVCHLPDLGQGQNRGRQRVMANGTINHDRIAGNGGCDGHLLDTARELGQKRTLGRQYAHVDGVKTILVHIYRDLHTCAVRQIGY